MVKSSKKVPSRNLSSALERTRGSDRVITILDHGHTFKKISSFLFNSCVTQHYYVIKPNAVPCLRWSIPIDDEKVTTSFSLTYHFHQLVERSDVHVPTDQVAMDGSPITGLLREDDVQVSHFADHLGHLTVPVRYVQLIHQLLA